MRLDDVASGFCQTLECGGTTDKYKWLQSEQDIVVEIPIPVGTKSKQIVAKWTNNSVKLCVSGETILDGKLHRQGLTLVHISAQPEPFLSLQSPETRSRHPSKNCHVKPKSVRV